MMLRRWFVTEPMGIRKGCLLALPGRSIPYDVMDRFCFNTGLDDTLRICLEPLHYEWYPAPNGVGDQYDAVIGCEEACAVLKDAVAKIEKVFGVPTKEIAVIGYSAGAVMALKLVMESKLPFAGCVSVAGAILEPDMVSKASHQTPILLRHNRDDLCFSWEERYLPMRDALAENGYNIYVHEEDDGGHGVCVEDAHLIGGFLAGKLGYEVED